MKKTILIYVAVVLLIGFAIAFFLNKDNATAVAESSEGATTNDYSGTERL